MEKETELYLIKRIKDLESANVYLQGKVKGYESNKEKHSYIVGKTLVGDSKLEVCDDEAEKDITTIEDSAKTQRKAEAFDTLVNILGLEVCHWVEENRYELRLNKLGDKCSIREETFKKLWLANNGD